MHSYEVEIKVLLGEKERKDIFLEKVEQEYPTLTLKRAESQRSCHHYNLDGKYRLQRSYN